MLWHGNEQIKEKYAFTDKFAGNIEDCKENHRVLFRNIENKVVNDIRTGRVSYDGRDCLRILKSFSLAQVGTNMFYELLMRKITKENLTLNESLVLLNYLPHALYDNEVTRTEEFVENGRTEEVDNLYKIIENQLKENHMKFDDKVFLESFQGLMKIKKPNYELVAAYLDEFEKRAILWNFEQKILFIQILGYFCKREKSIFDKIEVGEVVKVTEETIERNKLSLKEISSLFWCYHHMSGLKEKIVESYYERIKRICVDYIKADKLEFDDLGYRSAIRYYDQHNIDPYDLEVILFFFEEVGVKGKIKTICEEALEMAKIEDVHPTVRKENLSIFKL